MDPKKSLVLTVFIFFYFHHEYCVGILSKDWKFSPELEITNGKNYVKRRSLSYNGESADGMKKLLQKRSAVFQIQVAKTTSAAPEEKTREERKHSSTDEHFELPVSLQAVKDPLKDEEEDLKTAENNAVLLGTGSMSSPYYNRYFPQRFHPNRHLYPSNYPRPGSYYTYIDHGRPDQHGRYRGGSAIEQQWNSRVFDLPFSADYSNLTSLEEVAAKIVYRPTVKPFQVKMKGKNETEN